MEGQNVTHVYLLYHGRGHGDEDPNFKVLGVFGTQEKAEDAIREYLPLSGFCDHVDGFRIQEYGLDELIRDGGDFV
jgi:hypothetical protein